MLCLPAEPKFNVKWVFSRLWSPHHHRHTKKTSNYMKLFPISCFSLISVEPWAWWWKFFMFANFSQLWSNTDLYLYSHILVKTCSCKSEKGPWWRRSMWGRWCFYFWTAFKWETTRRSFSVVWYSFTWESCKFQSNSYSKCLPLPKINYERKI